MNTIVAQNRNNYFNMKKITALFLLSPLLLSDENIKIIECEDSGGLEVIESGPEKGKKGTTHSGNFFWTIIDYKQNEIGYFNEKELRKNSRDDIEDFKFKIKGYRLKIEPEDLKGLSKSGRTIVSINRTTLNVIVMKDDYGIKHGFTKICKLISAEELESRVLEEYLDFKNARKL